MFELNKNTSLQINPHTLHNIICYLRFNDRLFVAKISYYTEKIGINNLGKK
jgi:signal peptidase I